MSPKDPPEKLKSKGVHWSDERRAMVGRRATSVAEPPAQTASGELETMERTYAVEQDGEPTPRPHNVDTVLDKLWDETREDVKKQEVRLAAAERRLVATVGEDGDNGKVGTLTGRVDALYSKAWWFLATAIGGLAGAAVKLIIVVRSYSALEAQVMQNTQASKDLRSQVQAMQAALIMQHAVPPSTVYEPDRSTTP
jgi:hypothetical protein